MTPHPDEASLASVAEKLDGMIAKSLELEATHVALIDVADFIVELSHDEVSRKSPEAAEAERRQVIDQLAVIRAGLAKYRRIAEVVAQVRREHVDARGAVDKFIGRLTDKPEPPEPYLKAVK